MASDPTERLLSWTSSVLFFPARAAKAAAAMAAPSPASKKSGPQVTEASKNRAKNQNTRRVHPIIPWQVPSPRTRSAQTHAITLSNHHSTAHFRRAPVEWKQWPLHKGVYSRQKDQERSHAGSGVSATRSCSVLPNRTDSVETTLSLAINPAISAVETRQSPKPRGTKRGRNRPPR